MILIILNVALAGFTGLLAWFLKELWGLWRESERHREAMQKHMYALEKSMIESSSIFREMVAGLRLVLAKDYVPDADFREFRDEYVRPSIHDLKERVSTIEHKALYGDKKE